jgi:hypothetical protein
MGQGQVSKARRQSYIGGGAEVAQKGLWVVASLLAPLLKGQVKCSQRRAQPKEEDWGKYTRFS